MSRFVRGRTPVCESKQGGENPNKKLPIGSLKNALGGIRTPDLLVRSQTLYPTGLQAQANLLTTLLYQQYKNLSSL